MPTTLVVLPPPLALSPAVWAAPLTLSPGEGSRNDVWVRSPRPPTDYIKKNGIFANPVRGGNDHFVYSHTYSFVIL
jgi:hypothetical protein